jgi:ectoine hydroxylase-related dioxygenase (phytanoyl-CoA dioxygenase family)
LWGVPGSHTEPPNSISNNLNHLNIYIDYLKRRVVDGRSETYLDPPPPHKEYSIEGAVPLEVPAGSIVLIHGNITHYSE